MEVFEVGILGAGVAGSFAAYKIGCKSPKTKTIVFDLGRPPLKRRRQLEGWLGCLPNSDGKFYLSDKDKFNLSSETTNKYYNEFESILSNVQKIKIIKDKKISNNLKTILENQNFNIQYNDYIQMYSKEIHLLSKMMSDKIIDNKNFDFRFDEEILDITKDNGIFTLHSETGEKFYCKKLILAVGRSGWRWAHQLYSKFGIVTNNNIAKYGIRVEMKAGLLSKDFNKTNFTLNRDDLIIGPFSWNGTIIPEDHVDLAITTYRANEKRWETDNVSFDIIGKIPTDNYGCEQTDRLAKLIFILSNDRIVKEKTESILNDKSRLSILSEFEWLKPALKDISNFIPEILTKSHYQAPTISALPSTINLSDTMESDIENMFVVGESACLPGLLSAAMGGLMVADFVENK